MNRSSYGGMRRSHQSGPRGTAGSYDNPSRHDLRHGAIAGLLGGGSIILLFSAFDWFFFGSFETADSLSRDLLNSDQIAADIGARLSFIVRIGLFTVVHFGVFVVLGVVLAKLFRMGEVRKRLLLGGLYGLTLCTVVFFGSLSLSGTELSAAPEWPAVLLGNFVAGLVMGGYLQLSESL